MKPTCIVFIDDEFNIRQYSVPTEDIVTKLHGKLVNSDSMSDDEIEYLNLLHSDVMSQLFEGPIDPTLFEHIVVTGWV